MCVRTNMVACELRINCCVLESCCSFDGGFPSGSTDQVMEHNVRETKDLMYAHGANLNFSSAQTYSRASNPVKDTINNFDHENKLRKESSKHKRRKDGDIYVVVSTLHEVDALNEITGRTHRGIGTIPKDPISALHFKDLNAWLSKHKKSLL